MTETALTTDRVPAITRREVAAIVAALRAIREMRDRAGARSYRPDPDAARTNGRLAARSDAVQSALVGLLIELEVYANSARAADALKSP